MCDCIAKVNKLLADGNSNTILDVPLTIDINKVTMSMNRVRIVTKKRDEGKRGRPKSLIATYCPFCGQLYSETEKTVEPDPGAKQEKLL